MKKKLYKSISLLLLLGLTQIVSTDAYGVEDAGLSDISKQMAEELYTSSEILNDTLLFPEAEKAVVIVVAETECTVTEGVIIDEAFIRENILHQVTVSEKKIAMDQVEIAITRQFFSSNNELDITYSLSGKEPLPLVNADSDFFVQQDFKVTVEEARLAAKPRAAATVLGTSDDEHNLYAFVQDVTLGDQYLTEDQYTVQLQESIATDVTGQKKVNVQVTLNEDPAKMTVVEVAVNVRWGNSIAISGEWTGTDTRRIVSALTLHSGPSISIEPGQGASSLDYSVLPTYNDLFFSTVSLYQADELGILNLSSRPNRQFSLKSKDTPKQIKEAWKNEIGERLNLNLGDIVQVWHGRKTGEKYERPWLYLIEQETFFDNTAGRNDVYYEVTDEGFKQVQLNTFSITNLTVPIYTDRDYFDTRIDELVDTGDISNVSKQIIAYPDTTVPGEKEAIIRVEQTSHSGEKIQYDYSVAVTVEEGKLKLSVPQIITFRDFTLQSEKQLIGRNSGDNEHLGLVIQDSRGAGVQGNYALRLSMDDNSVLSQYVVYKDSPDAQEQFLNHSAIQIFSSKLEENPAAPSEKAPLHAWNAEQGLFLSVPADEPLKAQTYTGTLKWTLTAGP